MKRFILLLLLVAMLPGAAATSISTVNVTVTVGDPSTVTVTQTYEEIDTEQISYLVPSTYDATGLTARDGIGELSCTVQAFSTGKELLCDPRARTNYTVEITYRGRLVDQLMSGKRFTYERSVSVPTDQVNVRVTLPEGYGLVERSTPYEPADAQVGSEGRRIFLRWTEENPELASRLRYMVRYEEVAAFERIPTWQLAGISLIFLLGLAGIAVYVRRGRERGKTIASIFPVLKEDEQEVLRYIIEEDGEIEQREIVSSLSYSKAKISRLVSDLEDRGLVEKEKAGRVNVVRLTREVGDLEGI